MYAVSMLCEADIGRLESAVGRAAWCEGYSIGQVRLAEAQREQKLLLHDIFGNPFRPVSLNPAWLSFRSDTIPNLARAAYDERKLPSGHLDVNRLAVLADALEEAGCDSPAILDHLRRPRTHIRGCWVLGLVLGKE